MIIKRLFRVLILVILFLISINTQSITIKKDDSFNHLLYNFEFTQFDKLIQSSNISQSEKEYYILKKNFIVSLLNNALGDNKNFLNKLSMFRNSLENDKKNKPIIKNYFIASYNTMEIVSHIFENEPEKAFALARSNYKELKKIAEKGIDDAYYDMAIHIVFFNKIRDKKKFIISLLGLEYDLELAKRYLEHVLKNGKLNKIESVFLLTEIYKMQSSNLNKAENFLAELYRHFPQNALFIYNYAVILVKLGKHKEAKNILEKNVLYFHDYNNLKPFYNFLIGDINLINQEYENAINNFSNFSLYLKDNSYIGEVNYKIAISKLLMGETNEARKYLSRTTLGNVDLESDVFFRNRASQVIDNIFNLNLIELFYIEVLLFNDNYSEAEKRVNKLKISKNEQYNLQLLIKAKIKINRQKIYEGYNILNEILESKSNDNLWLKTKAAILISEIKIKNNKKSDASYYLSIAEKHNNYFFKDNFKKRIEYLKIMLKN